MTERRMLVMADPAFFQVEYAINPHMSEIGGVDVARARAEWEGVKAAFEALGLEVAVVPPVAGLPDLVFAANQTFPYRPGGVVLGQMRHPQRQPEVVVFERFLRELGVTVLRLPEPVAFEGTGDGAWWPGRRLVLGGWGFRTERRAWDLVSELLEVDVLPIRLVDPRFYHLDTAIQLLDEQTALYVEEAFDAEGTALLQASVPRLLRVPLQEALALACNGYAPDGRHYVVQGGCPATRALVEEAGLEVVEVDTTELRKSGGSVYCIKLQLL